MTEETKTVCPQCGSTLVIEVANQKHCNACALDFDLERNPVAKVERYPESGFRPRIHGR